MNQLILTDLVEQVAIITLNRPDRHNSLIPALLEELSSAIANVRNDNSIQAVVLQANGSSFSTGADMKGFFDNLGNLESYADHIVGLLHQIILDLVELNCPIVAAVHGIVTGGSIGMVLASDVILVTRTASFTPYYSDVGFSPDGGWTAMLPSIIGAKRAAAVLMQNQSISASLAVDWGMADHIIPSGVIRAEAFECARHLAQKKAGSITATKRLLADIELEANLEKEQLLFVQQITTPEARQGILDFMNR
jgi:enoyl-CoA hydratase/carnithine racemase